MSQNCLGDLFLGLGQIALALVGLLALLKGFGWLKTRFTK